MGPQGGRQLRLHWQEVRQDGRDRHTFRDHGGLRQLEGAQHGDSEGERLDLPSEDWSGAGGGDGSEAFHGQNYLGRGSSEVSQIRGSGDKIVNNYLVVFLCFAHKDLNIYYLVFLLILHLHFVCNFL